MEGVAVDDKAMQSNMWKLKCIRMFFWMHFFGAVLIPFYTDWGGLTLSQALFLNSWFMFWNFVLEVPTGTVADFLGRKISLLCGCVMAALAALVYVSRPDFSRFLLAEFLFAVAYTLHSGADEALAYDSLKALDAPMRAYAFAALAAFLVALTLKEPRIHGQGQSRTHYFTILREGCGFFARHKILLMLTVELSLTNALAWGIIWLFQPLLAKAGLSIRYFGIVHALAAAGQIVLLSNIERAENILGSKRRLLLAMAGAAGAAFIILAFAESVPLVALAIVVAFTFSLPRIPVFSAYMQKYIPSDKRATVLSLASMCRTLAIVVVNPLIGLLADWSLSWTMLLLGGSILAATALSRIEERHLVE